MAKQNSPENKTERIVFYTTPKGKQEIEKLAEFSNRKKSEFCDLAVRGLIEIDRKKAGLD